MIDKRDIFQTFEELIEIQCVRYNATGYGRSFIEHLDLTDPKNHAQLFMAVTQLPGSKTFKQIVFFKDRFGYNCPIWHIKHNFKEYGACIEANNEVFSWKAPQLVVDWFCDVYHPKFIAA